METERDEQPKADQDSMLTTLPEEVITEILLKLPVKSLLQLRSVSKSWLSLISSPHFAKTHLLLSARNNNHSVILKFGNRDMKDCSLGSLLTDYVAETFDLDYPDKIPYGFPHTVGSFNGLICLSVWVDGRYDLFLWNPSIRKCYGLPNYKCKVGYIFQLFGFAYDELQDDYKVVGIFFIERSVRLSRVEVEIYSLKSNSWKRIDDFQGAKLLEGTGKLVDRKLHWVDKDLKIVSIDLAVEKWAVIEQPSCFNEYAFLELGVFGSDLSVFCYNKVHHAHHVDVWVMKEYGVKDSWTKMFTIKYPVDSSTEYIISSPIFMSNDGEILLENGSRLTKCNAKDDSVKFIDFTKLAKRVEAKIYVKSLIWPFLTKGAKDATTTEVDISRMKIIE